MRTLLGGFTAAVGAAFVLFAAREALAAPPPASRALQALGALLCAGALAAAAANAVAAARGCAARGAVKRPTLRAAGRHAALCLFADAALAGVLASGGATGWPLASAAGHARVVFPLRIAAWVASNMHFVSAMAILTGVDYPADAFAVIGMSLAMALNLVLEVSPVGSVAWNAASFVACCSSLAFIFIVGRSVADLARAASRGAAVALAVLAAATLALYTNFAFTFNAARVCGGDGAGSCLTVAAERRTLSLLEAARAVDYAVVLAVTAAVAARVRSGGAGGGSVISIRALTGTWTANAAARRGGSGGSGLVWLANTIARLWMPTISVLVAAASFGFAVRTALPAAMLPADAHAGSAAALAVSTAQSISFWLVAGVAVATFFFIPLVFAGAPLEVPPSQAATSTSPRAADGTVSMAYVEEKHVTMLFADVVGYSAATAVTSAVDVMAVMAELFHHFDALHEAEGVRKIETVGDDYVSVVGAASGAAGGARAPSAAEQAATMARLALALVAAAHEHAWPDGTQLEVRVGLHCGAVTSGVLGDKLPHWGVFGHNVVLASRMESAGMPGRVHVSAAFAEALGAGAASAGCALIRREPPAELKGIGRVVSYWIETVPPAPLPISELLA